MSDAAPVAGPAPASRAGLAAPEITLLANPDEFFSPLEVRAKGVGEFSAAAAGTTELPILYLDEDIVFYQKELEKKINKASRIERAGAQVLGWSAPLLALYFAGQRVLGLSGEAWVSNNLLSKAVQQILTQLAGGPLDLLQLMALFSLIQRLCAVGQLDSDRMNQLLQAADTALQSFVRFGLATDPQLINLTLLALADGCQRCLPAPRLLKTELDQVVSLCNLLGVGMRAPYLWWREPLREPEFEPPMEQNWYRIDFDEVSIQPVH